MLFIMLTTYKLLYFLVNDKMLFVLSFFAYYKKHRHSAILHYRTVLFNLDTGDVADQIIQLLR